MRLLLYTLLVTALALPGISLADCSDGSCIPGRGPASKDCHAEYSGTGLMLNFPWDTPTKTRPKKMLRCFDGDPGCDLDGQVNGSCRFNVDVCLFKTLLQTYLLPDFTTSGVTVLDGWVYVGYGVFGGTGGVRAYRIQ